jgi:hypothetical protein
LLIKTSTEELKENLKGHQPFSQKSESNRFEFILPLSDQKGQSDVIPDRLTSQASRIHPRLLFSAQESLTTFSVPLLGRKLGAADASSTVFDAPKTKQRNVSGK